MIGRVALTVISLSLLASELRDMKSCFADAAMLALILRLVFDCAEAWRLLRMRLGPCVAYMKLVSEF